MKCDISALGQCLTCKKNLCEEHLTRQSCQDHMLAAQTSGGWRDFTTAKPLVSFIKCPCWGSYNESTKVKHGNTKVHRKKFPNGDYPFQPIALAVQSSLVVLPHVSEVEETKTYSDVDSDYDEDDALFMVV